MLRRCTPRNDAERNKIAFKGLDVVRQYAALLERRVQRGTRARKALVVTRQTNLLGRSMIEMLGVLAIIGVLSVGGIAGYSKAMEKWKIDKLMAEYNQLILGLLEYKDDLQKNVEGEPFLTDLVISLNLMPNTWKKLNGQFLEDSQGNWLEIRYRQADNYDINGHGLIIDFLLGGMETDDKGNQKSENFASKTCVELYNTILKPLHYTITGARVWGGNLNYFAGDRYCTKDYICLADATLNQIHEMCNSCDRTSRCNVTVFF